MICLDTNAVIAAINRRKPELRRRLESAIAAGAPIGIPTIVLFEMRYGIARSARPQENAAILAAFLTLALHRVRERLVSQRTGIINQIRAFLLERGVAVRQFSDRIAEHPCCSCSALVALHRTPSGPGIGACYL
jgi:tRNA(fMet)-specific endonuclease VapC